MKINFPHGKEEIPVSFPERRVVKIFRMKEPATLTGKEIEKALGRPSGSRRLKEIACGRKDAVIVVSDITRYIPYPVFLPYLLSNWTREESVRAGFHSWWQPAVTVRPAPER